VAKRKAVWQAERVKALRRHLAMTQEALARELGTRQQTISEWETGLYQPRGLSERLLSLVAERAGFEYDAGPREEAAEPEEGT
jgi:DNA-binding transcriptional regulator YiaG